MSDMVPQQTHMRVCAERDQLRAEVELWRNRSQILRDALNRKIDEFDRLREAYDSLYGHYTAECQFRADDQAELERTKGLFAEAVKLLRRYCDANSRAWWEDGETESEVARAIRGFMTDLFGSDWKERQP